MQCALRHLMDGAFVSSGLESSLQELTLLTWEEDEGSWVRCQPPCGDWGGCSRRRIAGAPV